MAIDAHSPVRRGRPTRLVATLLAATLLTLGLSVTANVVTAAPAQALCVTPAMEGDWHNIDPATRSIVRTQVQFVCNDVIICDADTGICTGGTSFYRIRPWGSCSPTACDWGWRDTVRMSDGWVKATYVYSYKTVDVWARTEAWYGSTYLRVWTSTDYTAADGRADYTSNDWFLN
ncbi:hypothetical protein [Catellatospora coxensis]|uniref:Uncharacterized protein n=1 Tax=Catellatospora coxensis TaxID=310354 RepID=A0A8J3KVN3_9ACTN|nr:hypothetical protein [Catellatospora coxensis]GIG07033.1 hypothetical protein Cco03nite_37330 [Catellatospora coxensis]